MKGHLRNKSSSLCFPKPSELLRTFLHLDEKGFPNLRWALRAAIIYVPGDYLGHYVSIVRVEGNWIKYDDDDVTALNERHALSSLKNNTYGCVSGVIYDRQ